MTNDNQYKNEDDVSFKLKAARSRLMLTQKEVAEASGVTTNYYARVERDEVSPSIKRLKKFMKVLKIKVIKILAD